MKKEVLGKLGKAKICNFDFAIIDEYIGYFDISMYDMFICQVAESFEDILDDRFCFKLVKISFFPQFRLKIALVAEFSDDVAVSIAREYLITFQDVGMI